MSELHIKNHFVPECYLKRWQGSNDKICVYRTLVSHQNVPIWKRFPVSTIAYHNHLYTQMVASVLSDDLERWLDKEYESPANAILDKVVSEQRLSAYDWDILIRFLAAQDVRTPSRLFEHIKRYNETLPEILQSTLDKLANKLERNEIAKSNEKVISENNSPIIPLKVTTEIMPGENKRVIKAESYVGRSTWIYSIKHLLENTEKILHEHKWTIIKPVSGYNWLTSDNPVIKLNFTSPKNYDLKGGWGKKKGNIIFPVGPEHAMFVEIGDRPMSKGTRLTVDQTKFFRKIIAENAHRMIFSNFFDMEVTRIRKRIVDPISFRDEKLEMESWHFKNSQLELEYLKNR